MALPTNIPTKAETEESDATTWIIVLLVLGTIIPMATRKNVDPVSATHDSVVLAGKDPPGGHRDDRSQYE